MGVDIQKWRKEYHPCETGIHVFQPEGGEYGGLTLANYPYADADAIRHLSSAGDGDDFDLLLDIMEGGDCVDNIPIRRQDLAAIDAVLRRQP